MHQRVTRQLQKVTVLVNGKVIKRRFTRKGNYPLTGSSILKTLVSYGTDFTNSSRRAFGKQFSTKKKLLIQMHLYVTKHMKATS